MEKNGKNKKCPKGPPSISIVFYQPNTTRRTWLPSFVKIHGPTAAGRSHPIFGSGCPLDVETSGAAGCLGNMEWAVYPSAVLFPHVSHDLSVPSHVLKGMQSVVNFWEHLASVLSLYLQT